jgi:hypothetical protein
MCESSLTPDATFKEFIDNLHKTIDNKYNDILDIYYNNVGGDISKDDYIDNYGSISNIVSTTHGITLEFPILPTNRWYIHHIMNIKSMESGASYKYYLIDNYGIIYKKEGWINRSGGYNNDMWGKQHATIGNSSYRLSNSAIDFIKTIGECSSIESINFKLLGEAFHNKFIQYKDLYKSGKLMNYTNIQDANNKLQIELEEKKKIISDLEKNIDNLNKNNIKELNEKANLAQKQKEDYEVIISQLKEDNDKLKYQYSIELKKASEAYSSDIKELEVKYKVKEDEYVDIIIGLKEERRNMRILLATTSTTDYATDDFRSCA